MVNILINIDLLWQEAEDNEEEEPAGKDEVDEEDSGRLV